MVDDEMMVDEMVNDQNISLSPSTIIISHFSYFK